MTEKMNPDHVAWCRAHWRALRENGRWGVPRSGLVFAKRHGRLALTDRMPHMAGMPITPEELREMQDADFENTVMHFGAIGVEVIDSTEETRA
jgi:hypothetical protein